MKAFVLTTIAGLLAGLFVHWRLQPVDSESAGRSQASMHGSRDSNSAQKPPPSPADPYANIPESEFPAFVTAAEARCPAADYQWKFQLLPLWLRWARFDPQSALEHVEKVMPRFIDSNEQRVMRYRVIDSMLAVWASHNAGEAVSEFLSRIFPGVGAFPSSDSEYPQALVETLSLRDIAAATSLVATFYGKQSPETVKAGKVSIGSPAFYAAAMQQENLPGFLRALRSLPGEEVRGQLCGEMIRFLIGAGIEGRREIIEKLPLPERWPPGILHTWANLAWDAVHEDPDPRQAADAWMSRVGTDDPGRSLVLEWIMSGWTERDPEGAGEWLRQWDGVPEADRARVTYAQKAAHIDPVAAFEWSKHFSKPRDQALLAQRIYLDLHRRDPDEANRWLTSQDLPEALISRLLGEGKSR